MDWKTDYKNKLRTLEEAALLVQSGDFIATGLGIGSCSPDMFEAILARHHELEGVNISDAVQVRPTRLYDPEFMKTLDGRINFAPSFGTAPVRRIYEAKRGDFLPNNSSVLGNIYGNMADVFIHMVTPPNKHGYVNLGLSNFYSMQAIREGRASGRQRVTIGEVNEKMPVILGENWMHVSEFDAFVENSTPMPQLNRSNDRGDVDDKIAGYVLELIKDGDTFQMGIGSIPEKVAKGLDGRHNLGIHTEMIPMGLPDLVEKGVVTNALKPKHKGVTVATFSLGDDELYEYARENPSCEFYPASYTNCPMVIAQYPNFLAMNMALMVDLSGQINSEGLGHRQISGSGGQLDFQIGAMYSDGGRALTLLTSARKMKDGSLESSIIPELPVGTPVSVPRTYADYIITEYGIAHLKNKTVRQRAEALISIAHPDLRGMLRESMRKNFYPR
ncbi:MAG TPA: acetyl-CoA hydrolase/transferase C-terminal domain-containing protein [Deltaproteobacteria bacterium]|nr:acetyl-CoA hydrolase/transferase C-terminal domain-containing protein [Deltaproteobacteria bacterium]HPR56386.1 acetyl-CoA hydrolase/transferase C-terminal domain-containing protein [Deltaproteobacteria bacterium]